MKKHLLFLLVTLYAGLTQAQTVSIEYLLAASPTMINKYAVGRNFHSVRLNMPFADDSILNPGVIKYWKGRPFCR